MRMIDWRRWPVMLFAVVACSSSPPSEPTHLKAVELGSAVDPQQRISAATRSFDPASVVFVAIATEGAGPATLTVQWVANTSLAKEESRSINPAGQASFAFQFKPSEGWPIGRSKVIFWLRDDEKHAAEFEVARATPNGP